jgi:hypothetical protein
MAFLTKNQIENIVESALNEVADFTGDIKIFEFKHFDDLHKINFLTKLNEFMNEESYYDREGNTDDERCYDIALSISLLNSWSTILDCINFVYSNHSVKKRNLNKLKPL